MPSVRKRCPCTSVMRVVTRYSAAGKNTARKRLSTRSYSLASASLRSCGICSVGMMAKWSDTFLLSKMRRLGLTQFSLTTVPAWRARPPTALEPPCARARMVSLTVLM